MKNFLSILILSSSLFGFNVTIQESNDHSITLKIDIPEPALNNLELGGQALQVPHWQKAFLSYDSKQQQLFPLFALPLLLPPDGTIPDIQVLDTQQKADRRLTNLKLNATDGESYADFSSINGQQWIDLIKAEDFRAYHTARIILSPYAISGQRLTEIVVRIDFPNNLSPGLSQDLDLIQTYLNADMAKQWAQIQPKRLAKITNNLPTGQWFKIPINERGIYRILPASFGGDIPESDPATWQVYSPFYEGRALPLALSKVAPTPDNLEPISMSTSGLDDGTFSGTDEINFFAQPLNDDFKGNNFTHLYGHQRYYWLVAPTSSSEIGIRVTPKQTSEINPTNTISSYEKRFYHENELHNQLHSGKSWVGEKFNGDSDQLSIFFEDDYLDEEGELQLDALMFIDLDAGNHQHNLNIEFNGLPFAINQNNSSYYKKIALSGTSGENILKAGFNTLSIYYTSSSTNSIIYLDSLRLAYDRKLAPSEDLLFGTVELTGAINQLLFEDIPEDFHLWDISNSSAVNEWLIQGNEFKVEDSGLHEIVGFSDDQKIDVLLMEGANLGAPVLRTPDKQAEYIIITPDIFLDEAERMRELREDLVPVDEQLDVEIVRIEDIYSEFSAGTQDLGAIKHFLHFVYFNWAGPQLRYVLLLGDTDYDYRNLTGQSNMMIPTYQKDGISDVGSYATDDKYTFLSSGIWDELPDIAIGRLPGQTPAQMKIMVDKILSYELNPEPGIWRNTVTLVADDPLRPSKSVENEHIRDSEGLSEIIPGSVHVNKIYLTEYPEVNDPNSPYIKKPRARDDFMQKLYDGTLLVNYLGHGSPTVWAQEEVFTVSDLGLVKTGMNLPFWVAGTCDWAKYDDVSSSCVPEELMLMESNGAVGILSTTRKTYSYFNNILLSHFFDYLFPDLDAGRSITVGDAIMMAKNVPAGSDINNEKYILFSDPALRLASPTRRGRISSVNPSVLQAMGQVSYTGATDTSLSENAMAAVTVYDTPTPVTRTFVINTSGSEGSISYTLPGKRIFRGLISVNDRDFSGAFTLPKDIKYSGEGGILRVQYWDDTGLDGSIFLDTLHFSGTDSTALDDTGPEILFISDNMILLNGDHFSANEALEIEIKDPQGINLTGSAGHGISLAIDEDWDNAYDVTELFEYDLDHSDLGRLSAYLTEIPPGDHEITVKAWDSQNNPNQASIRLDFFAADDFRIYDLFNYPNPMVQDTEITYMISHAAEIDYSIYTLAGRKISGEAIGFQAQGFNSFPWDGRDLYGSSLANGVYILVIEARNSAYAEPTQSLQKLVIAR